MCLSAVSKGYLTKQDDIEALLKPFRYSHHSSFTELHIPTLPGVIPDDRMRASPQSDRDRAQVLIKNRKVPVNPARRSSCRGVGQGGVSPLLTGKWIEQVSSN